MTSTPQPHQQATLDVVLQMLNTAADLARNTGLPQKVTIEIDVRLCGQCDVRNVKLVGGGL